jgi:clan AA aspartic protease (TIGR02281 family)
MIKYLLILIGFFLSEISFSQVTINMEKEGGVFTVPCSVNGLKLKFIFDTGASDVSISMTEAMFMLKNGYLNSDDIIGKQKYVDASGKISVGTTINIRQINFSGLTLLNIKASIVNELSAPLLLGQSAMAKLGKFIFDPANGKLTVINNVRHEINHKSISKLEVVLNENNLDEKYGLLKAAKAAYLAATKATATTSTSGLQYVLLQKGTDLKPIDGSTIYFKYAGFFEDGNLFDSNLEDVAKTFGQFNQARADQNGYQAFPFEAGKKEGMIPGFLEGLSLMNIGDRMLLFLPSNLAYGEKGAGGVIPPNTNLVFELEISDKAPAPKQ